MGRKWGCRVRFGETRMSMSRGWCGGWCGAAWSYNSAQPNRSWALISLNVQINIWRSSKRSSLWTTRSYVVDHATIGCPVFQGFQCKPQTHGHSIILLISNTLLNKKRPNDSRLDPNCSSSTVQKGLDSTKSFCQPSLCSANFLCYHPVPIKSILVASCCSRGHWRVSPILRSQYLFQVRELLSLLFLLLSYSGIDMSVSAMYFTFITRTHPMYADTFKKRIHFNGNFYT